MEITFPVGRFSGSENRTTTSKGKKLGQSLRTCQLRSIQNGTFFDFLKAKLAKGLIEKRF